jgi:carbamoyl-phosphate synthase large subunit
LPRSQELKRVLILGSGPIVIGQACEFDYSGTQACKALMKEGLEVILINSNPATIMTDPEIATRVYVEPLTTEVVDRILSIEKPQAIIPTLGGQTALNLALQLHDQGLLKKHNVSLLGADPTVIRAAEDREKFRDILDKVGAKYPKSKMVRNLEEGQQASDELGLPLILRPNFTLGGGGGGIAYTVEEYQKMIAAALLESPTSECLVEESILGWKEFELEVMRDHKGTFVVVCSIENFDPCGVHTGDSITFAPQQTLSDSEYQSMRDEACKILNEVGVQTGGANIQFAVHPTTQERLVIEMNPRVSRSSALASKATGFPIAKIAALLAVGYSLDEIKNDITKVTPCCYEPALDYVVCKIPRFAFEKFPGSKDLLTTQMKSVGEVMGIGRTLQEAFMKAVLSLEFHAEGFPNINWELEKISYPNSQRLFHIYQAFRDGRSVEELQAWTQITPYFLVQLAEMVALENEIRHKNELSPELLWKAKRKGFSDALIGRQLGKNAEEIFKFREKNQIRPRYSQVDTCAGEFKSETPYFYSSYWPRLSTNSNFDSPILVIGSGPNRIGQGIEFDYGCVRAVKALQKQKHQVIMVNSNPETVSTDYDTSDILFFEPLTIEHVSEILAWTRARGFLAQFGGQTPINLAHALVKRSYQLLGTSLAAIDGAEDRAQFSKICFELELKIPQAAMVFEIGDALKRAQDIGYPVICRPSYVLGGRRMEVIENAIELQSYFFRHQDQFSAKSPCLMDQFLEGALEVDVDLVRGTDWHVIGGIVEHIEAAGVHSGDSMGVLPPQRLKNETCASIEKLSARLADRLGIIGHLNLQLAIQRDQIYVLEANPRSSRSVPFIAKATGIPLIDLGVAAVLGLRSDQIHPEQYRWQDVDRICVKGVVFPFKKFSEADSILGPEMKSTGESMGQGRDYSEALVKALLSSHVKLPSSGEVFFSLRDKDKSLLFPIAEALHLRGYKISATGGTAQYFQSRGIPTSALRKVHEGRPHCVDQIRGGKIAFVVNTTRGRNSVEASFQIRRACTDLGIPCLTESDAAEAFVLALAKNQQGDFEVGALKSKYPVILAGGIPL